MSHSAPPRPLASDHAQGPTKILVDGRVFSTAAVDRGMGVYVDQLIASLREGGYHVTVLLFRNCRLPKDSWIVRDCDIRFADFVAAEYQSETTLRTDELHLFTSFLSEMIEQDGFDLYLDGTPFLGPQRFDLFSCPVVTVFYDFIPLRHPTYYLGAEAIRTVYQNGLARLAKADGIICISDTVRGELTRYLGIADDRLTTIYPRIDDSYLDDHAERERDEARSFVFSIVGGHKSKNPERSLAIFAELSQMPELDFRLNAPTPDQQASLQASLPDRPNLHLTGSIAEAEKRSLQANAVCVAHLSIEEGFGIPCLEAIFLGRKILALDIPVNREIMQAGWDNRDGAALLLPKTASSLDPETFRAFLRQPPDPEFHRRIKAYFRAAEAATLSRLTGLIGRATAAFEQWKSELKAAITTSLPGTNCGVADYSVGYVRSAQFGFMVFCAGENQQYLTPLPHARVGTVRDFARFRAAFPNVPCLFNFAFSAELFAGIDLMREHAGPADVVLVHERRYFDGLLHHLAASKRTRDLQLGIAREESDASKTQLAIRLAFDPNFNVHAPAVLTESPISSQWLTKVPARFVSHLPPALIEQMTHLSNTAPGEVINDLGDFEERLSYVPMGIDDRSHAGLARAASRLRLSRGIQPSDVVVGHFGLILDDIKRLWEIALAVVTAAAARERAEPGGRRVVFALVGKIVDLGLFQRIQSLFADAGLADSLIHANPALETDFDAEIAACDGLFCFRTQQRGHMSHVYVRALSIGVPTFVNRRSGYGYDPRTTIDDDDLETGIADAIGQLFDRRTAADLRRCVRATYEQTHRGEHSLQAIMSGTDHV